MTAHPIPADVGAAIAEGLAEIQRDAKRAISRIEMPPASAAYVGRTTSMAKRLADTVRARGIQSGTLALRIARQVDPHIRPGQRMVIAGAEFTVAE